MGHLQYPIEDVRLERIKVRFPGGGTPSVANVPVTTLAKIPEYAEHYPEFNMFGEMPAWALFVRHAKGISIKDCSFSTDATDYRPAIVADDVSGLTGVGLKISGADKSKTLVVRNGKGVRVDGINIKVAK